MFREIAFIAFCALILSFVPGKAFSVAPSKAKVFFNQFEGSRYTDPYRGIERKGQNLEQALVDVILSAKKSVNVAVQELRLPRVAKALALQHKRGLAVRVVLENKYNNTLLTAGDPDGDDVNQHEASKFVELFALVDLDGNGEISAEEMDARDAIHILRRAGVEIKDDTFDGSMGSGLMHHKFVVADNKTLAVGTANFTMSGTHGDFLNKETTGNANSLLVLESPELAKIFNDEFFTMWGGRNGQAWPKFGMGKGYRGARTARLEKSEVKVQFSPTSRGMSWNLSVNGLIGKTLQSAKREVLMALFVFSDQRLADILERERGENESLRIGLLVEPRFAFRNYSEMLDMWGLALLDENCSEEEGNRPWKIPLKTIGTPSLESGDMLHHKFAVVDRETVIVGSQNWSASANFQNDENVLVIKNKELAEAYAREYKRLERLARLRAPLSLLNRIERMTELCAQR